MNLSFGRLLNVVSKSANYTATAADDVILCDASGAGFTVTLPAAAGLAGKMITIKASGIATVNQVSIAASGTDKIEGITGGAKKLGAYFHVVTLVSDGVASWWSLEKEQIAAYYRTAAGQNVLVAGSVINFDTKVFDTHNAVTVGASWTFVCPETRLYLISASTALTCTAAQFTPTLNLNTDTPSTLNKSRLVTPASAGSQLSLSVHWFGPLAQGTGVQVVQSQDSGSTRNLVADNQLNTISIIGI